MSARNSSVRGQRHPDLPANRLTAQGVWQAGLFGAKDLILTLLILTSYSLLLPPPSLANSIYNRSPWPQALQGLDAEKDNTDFLDAVHPCNQTHGRSFQVTHVEGFKLVGLSVYVYVPNSQTGKFDRNLFRLSFLASNLSPLASDISSIYSSAIWMDGGGQTSEVYFPLNTNINGGVAYTAILECLTDEPDTFRVPESSRIDDGLTQYYDSTTSQPFTYYMEGRKVLFTTFSERNAPHFPALAQSAPSLASSPSPLAPKYHPVIFVHGLGGDPTNFESDAENRNYVKLLTDLGYPRDYIHLYSYGYKYNSLKRINEYNYQGDVREIAQGMEVAVNTLSALNKSQGGDGKVDIVAHSLGNLVTRQYLLTHKDNHKIRRYIAVGAPFKGSWIAGINKGVYSFPVLGKRIEQALATAVLNAYNSGKPHPLDNNAVAVKQVAPGSDFLDGPNGLNKTNISGVEVIALYGDIKTTVKQKIFNRSINKELSIGDGIILTDSATYLGWTNNSKKLAFSDTLLLETKVRKLNDTLAFELEIPKPESIGAFHTELLSRQDFKDKVSCFLTKDTTSSCN